MNRPKRNYANNFPIIIMVIVSILVIVLVNIYLGFKPFKTIYRNGYMVLSKNMTSNLLNNKMVTEELDIGAALVGYGDPIYKQIDSYYVGIEEKQEVDYEYPVYSADGLTIYSLNNNFSLINSNFERLKGYPNLYIDRGILYNEGDLEPADDVDYLFYHIDNSVYINTQIIKIKTLSSEYTIPVNSPLYFNIKYLNYYTFDGKKFEYNKINDIYYDSLITIGNYTYTYEELLLKLEAVKEVYKEEEVKENETEEEYPPIENPDIGQEIIDKKFVKPTVSIEDFKESVYALKSSLSVNDPSHAINMNPTFEVYDSEGNLYLRKKISTLGEFKISGLSADSEYKIIGKYKYKNEYGNTMVVTFFEGDFKTKSIEELEEIVLEKGLGDRYSNKIEIKDVLIENINTEAIDGIKKVTIAVWKNDEIDVKKSTTLSYTKMKNLLRGDSVTISSANNLQSNTIYNYEILFYDVNDNILESVNNKGSIQTIRQAPSVTYLSKINDDANNIKVDIGTKNSDDVKIYNYNYKLVDEFNDVVKEYYGGLSSKDGDNIHLQFKDLDYGRNYKLIIAGQYDLEDGKGVQNLYSEKEFTTDDLSKEPAIWYEDEMVSPNSISTNIYISSKFNALSRESTKIYAYLVDENGNDIVDEDGKLKYCNEYNNLNLTNRGYLLYNAFFEGLDSNTKYFIKIKIEVEQISEKIEVEKVLKPEFITSVQDAYVNVIHKRLLGNTLSLSFRIVDINQLMGLSNEDEKEIIVEVYEGEYDSYNDVEDLKWVNRSIHKLNEESPVLIELKKYSLKAYTIFVSTDSYNGANIKKMLKVKELDGTYSDSIKVSSDLKVKAEIQDQRFDDNLKDKLISSINVMHNMTTNLYVFDCSNESCKKLGYFNYNSFTPTSASISDYILNYNGKNNLKIKNDSKDENHTLYFLVERDGVNLKSVSSISEYKIDGLTYVMYYLKYNTKDEIYNIDDASDFQDQTLFSKQSNQRQYVVTDNLDFSGNYNAGTLSFSGIIDFQGYSVNLFEDPSHSKFNVFSALNSKGILKNAVLNYNLDYAGIVKQIRGFVNVNSGTIENFIVNVSQKNDTARSNGLGLLAYKNSGIIKNFVLYLNSDIHIYGDSSIVTSENTGIIEDGYIATYNSNGMLGNSKVILYDKGTNHGAFAHTNSGTIKNVYNLTSAEVDTLKGYTGKIASISYDNKTNSKVNNTISIIESVTKPDNTYTGMPVYSGNKKNFNNNYFVDLKNNNISDSLNTRISSAVTNNSGFWELLFKLSGAYNINSLGEYYPLIKMSPFMDDMQKLIKTEYRASQKKIEILSIETISSDIEENEYKVKLIINNPNQFKIKKIDVNEIESSIEESVYDRENLATIITLKLYLGSDSIAKSNYEIMKLHYGESNETINYGFSNSRTINIDAFRTVSDYKDLIEAINRNENIFIQNNIYVGENNTLYPESNINYKAILDGNSKTINFNNGTINKSFLNSVSGTLKNLRITNFELQGTASNIGFISTLSSANVENVALEQVKIIFDEGKNIINKNLFVGALAATVSDSLISKVSVSDVSIEKTNNGGIAKKTYIGGLAGRLSVSTVNNSYVYNLNVPNMYLSSADSLNDFGGLTGESYYGTIKNCYTTGNIISGQSNIGGLVGDKIQGSIDYSYSAMTIFSSGNNISGIAGKINGGTIKNNLFAGKLEGIASSNYYSIASSFSNPNYVLNKLPTDGETTIISNSLLEFDTNNNAFSQNPDSPKKNLPYLNDTSFAEQKVKTATIDDKLIESSNVEISYNYDDACEIDNKIENSERISNICATSVNLTFKNLEGLEVISVTSPDGNLIIDKEENSYRLSPKDKYINGYTITVGIKKNDNSNVSENITLKTSFYRHVNDANEWNKIANYVDSGSIIGENVLLLNDIELDANSTGKNIINLFGNNKTISTTQETTLDKPLIEYLNGTGLFTTFKDISIKGDRPYLGIIAHNKGNIQKVKFENIEINNSEYYTGIIADGISDGYIKQVELKNISIVGNSYVGGLIAYNSSDYDKQTISDIEGINLYMAGDNYVGGIAGHAVSKIENVNVSDVVAISIQGHVGGISGSASVTGESDAKRTTAENVIIYSGGNYAGGISGVQYSGIGKNYISVSNILISDNFEYILNNLNNIVPEPFYTKIIEKYNDVQKSGLIKYVGGSYGYGSFIYSNYISNLVIGNVNTENANFNNINDFISRIINSEYAIENINANNVGGIVGYSYQTNSNLVKNAAIYGGYYVGGIAGNTTVDTKSINNNVVLNADMHGLRNIGGIVGYYSPSSSLESDLNLPVVNNMVLNSNIVAVNILAGGLMGSYYNNKVETQNALFKDNLIENVYIKSVIANNANKQRLNAAGGIIGYMTKVPEKSEQALNGALFYGEIVNFDRNKEEPNPALDDYVYIQENQGPNLIGSIVNLNSSPVYGENPTLSSVVYNSNFRWYCTKDCPKDNVQEKEKLYDDIFVNNIEDLKSTMSSSFYYPEYEGISYLPITDVMKTYLSKNIVEYSDLVEIPSIENQRLNIRRMKQVSNNRALIHYDVYAVDTDKINIEFSDIEENMYLRYEIGNYKSDEINVNKKTYTISYDFKNPIKIYTIKNSLEQEKIINAKDLRKTISLIDNKTYYINNGMLYGESKGITGNFVNLYGSKALTSDGEIYDVSSKSSMKANIDYRLLNDKPLYSFTYNGQKIDTYYNYSLVDSIVDNHQIIIRNGIVNVIDSNLKAKKDSYIIDYYNGENYQIVLKETGVLYSLNNKIKTPSDFKNSDILDIYTDIMSSSNLVTIKYMNGEVYTFNYRTGEKLFSNISKENLNFLEYLKDKFFGTDSNEIEQISEYEKYTEIELLKSKIEKVSVEEAKNNLKGDNLSVSKDKNYVIMYNDITSNYDIYNVEELFKNNQEESENIKIYKDYELVKFYNNKEDKKSKFPLSGIIVFSLSIMAVMSALYLLIRRARNKKILRGVE